MVHAIPDGLAHVIPHLVVSPAAEAIDFYERAFGAREASRTHAPDGRILHATVLFGEYAVYLADDFPEMADGKPSTPGALGGSPVGLHRFVEDVDAAVARAEDAGAEVTMPPADMFWGDRYGQVRDPFGHVWSLATRVREVSPDEADAAVAEMFGGAE